MILEILFTATAILWIFYKFFSQNFNYWRILNVPCTNPTPIFGNFLKTFFLRESFGETLSGLYNKFNTRYFGFFIFNQPALVIKDPELIKYVLVKDFNNFSDRNVLVDEKIDSIQYHMLFFSKTAEWKDMRNRLTPLFTSIKLKNMFPLMKNVSHDMMCYLSRESLRSYVDAKKLCEMYSIDTITSCAFGVKGQSFQLSNTHFKKISELLTTPTLKNSILQSSHFIAHGLVKLFKIPFLTYEVQSIMRGVFSTIINDREESKMQRQDAIDLMIQIKGQTSSTGLYKYEGDRLIAQLANFMLGGIDTLSGAASFALYELSLNQEIQNKLRNEIKNTLSQYQCINYECVNSIDYLSMVVDETLRKYPIFPFLDRQCLQDYQIPNSNITLVKGTSVFIPLLGLHYDPKYFPNPQKFDPERFSKKNKPNINSYAYLPFGCGPRVCIGTTFALLAVKICVMDVILNFEILPSASTPKVVEFSPKAFVLLSKTGLPLQFKKLTKD